MARDSAAAAKERERKAAEEAARQVDPDDVQSSDPEDTSDPEVDPQAAQEATDAEAQRAAQMQASAHGTVPPPAPAPQVSDPEVVEKATEVANSLTDLSRAELDRLATAVNHALTQKGADPATTGPTLEELSGSLPLNTEAGEKLDIKSAAKPFDNVEPEEIINWAVRQSRGAAGWTGPAYLRVVTVDGQKHTAELT